MTLLQMIEEWRKGCSCAQHKPENCPECILVLIDAMEFKLKKQVALEKLKSEFEAEIIGIKSGGYGVATLALLVACAAMYASQVRNIIAANREQIK